MGRTLIHTLLQAALLLAGLVGNAVQAAEHESIESYPVWLTDEAGMPGAGAPALLSLPPSWVIGDAAAVIVPGSDWREGERDGVIAALLASGSGVLELSAPRSEGTRGVAMRRDLLLALQNLRLIEGAGLVVAIGVGEGGEAALYVAAHLTTPEGWRYAAAVRLSPDAPAFQVGAADPLEAWEMRAPLLCDLLSAGRLVSDGGFAAACRGGLLSR